MTFNRERGEWPLVVDGADGKKTYKMRLTTNAMAELEDAARGRTWDQIILGLMRGSVSDCRLLIWAALRQFHRDIATDGPDGLTAVGNLIDDAGGVEGISEQIKAFVGDNAKPADGKGSANPPAAIAPANGTGERPTPDSSRPV